jgi:hypothetical protein
MMSQRLTEWQSSIEGKNNRKRKKRKERERWIIRYSHSE